MSGFFKFLSADFFSSFPLLFALRIVSSRITAAEVLSYSLALFPYPVGELLLGCARACARIGGVTWIGRTGRSGRHRPRVWETSRLQTFRISPHQRALPRIGIHARAVAQERRQPERVGLGVAAGGRVVVAVPVVVEPRLELEPLAGEAGVEGGRAGDLMHRAEGLVEGPPDGGAGSVRQPLGAHEVIGVSEQQGRVRRVRRAVEKRCTIFQRCARWPVANFICEARRAQSIKRYRIAGKGPEFSAQLSGTPSRSHRLGSQPLSGHDFVLPE
jgi:hypothetical protein